MRHQLRTILPFILNALALSSMQTEAYCAHALIPVRVLRRIGISSPRKVALTEISRRTRCSSAMKSYGKGAEIWPESNNDIIELSDSFPNGNIPSSAILAIEQSDMETIHQRVAEEGSSRVQSHSSKIVRKLLRKAASKDELDTEALGASSSIGRLPVAIGCSLLLKGWVRPMDVGVVACLTTYLIILRMMAQSPSTTGAPVMPACPPQGHVPFWLSRPLGVSFESSPSYHFWLQLGAILGLVGPMVWLLAVTTSMGFATSIDPIRAVARPIFLLCSQMATEALSKQTLMPLPIRILIPILYNAIRLMYLWPWAAASTWKAQSLIGRIGKSLGVANLVYWSLNLFVFLIPIASVRYMRAHFFAVEAETVITRTGLEGTVGLIPNSNIEE